MQNRNWGNIPFHPKKWPFFYGWMVLVWGTLGIIMSIPGQTIGVSVFTESLIHVLRISRDELSLAYMFGTIGSSFLLPWAGRQYDKYGARLVAFVSALGLALIICFFSQIDKVVFQFLSIHSGFLVLFITFVGFFLLRFFGQGVLTLASRNMMVQWFDKRRGFATGFSNVFVALTFSVAPVFLYFLMTQFSWRVAWLIVAAIVGLLFPVFVLLFYRDKPEDSGLMPDGNYQLSERRKKSLFPVIKNFNLQEVRKNYSFWVYSLMLAMQGLYITAFTFHVLSIFKEAGLEEKMAISIFQPTALVAVVITLIFSTLSDYLKLKYLYVAMGIGACAGALGVMLLGEVSFANLLIIAGNGVMGGLFSVLSSVTWPRYFGRMYLGAISGQAVMVIVFASALGPILFSQSLSHFGSYFGGAAVCLGVYFALSIASFFTTNPQEGLKKV
ncbi:MAG: MFS transporter [Cyclobacteriaceae bacterium]